MLDASIPVCPGEVVLLKGLPSRCSGGDLFRLFKASCASLKCSSVVRAHTGTYSILVFDEAKDAEWLVKQVDGCVLEYEGVVQFDRGLSAWRPVSFKDLTQVDGDTVLRELFGDASGGANDAAPHVAHQVCQARLRVWRRDSGAVQRQQQQQPIGSGQAPVAAVAAAAGEGSAAGETELHEAVRQALQQQQQQPSTTAAAGEAPPQQQHPAVARERSARRGRRSGQEQQLGPAPARGGSCSTTSVAASTASVSEAGTPTAARSASDLPLLAAEAAAAQQQRQAQQQQGQQHKQEQGQRQEQQQQEQQPARQLYASNLSFRTTEADLAELFGRHGRVTLVKVPGSHGPGGGGCRGYGFVTFARPEDAAAALRALDGATVEGRVIKIVVSRTQSGSSGSSSSSRARARKAAAAAHAAAANAGGAAAKQQPAAAAVPRAASSKGARLSCVR